MWVEFSLGLSLGPTFDIINAVVEHFVFLIEWAHPWVECDVKFFFYIFIICQFLAEHDDCHISKAADNEFTKKNIKHCPVMI